MSQNHSELFALIECADLSHCANLVDSVMRQSHNVIQCNCIHLSPNSQLRNILILTAWLKPIISHISYFW